MMIGHASLPADAPAHVARVLAEIMQGESLPFPPAGEDAFIVWSKDERIELQVFPRGHEMVPGPSGAASRVPEGAQSRHAESHIALYLDRPAAEIVAIARREGWPAGDYDRGGFFRSVEVWVEGAFLIECFDPEATARYEAFMTKTSWRAWLERVPS